jgi:hypothetical protein
MNYYISDTLLALIVLLVMWDLAWKAFALIKAAKAKDRFWFVAILVINSIGILPILYIFRGEKFAGFRR